MKSPAFVVCASLAVIATLWVSAQTNPSRSKLEYHGHGFRVLRTHLDPHQTTEQHTDPGRFEVILTDADLRSYSPDGTAKDIHVSKGTSAWTPSMTHRSENVGSTPFEEIEIIPDDEMPAK